MTRTKLLLLVVVVMVGRLGVASGAKFIHRGERNAEEMTPGDEGEVSGNLTAVVGEVSGSEGEDMTDGEPGEVNREEGNDEEVLNRALEEDQKLESNITLNVSDPPRVSIQPASPVKVELGYPVTLKCLVNSKPQPISVLWKKDGFEISQNYTLVFNQVSLNDSGSYLCTVINSNGVFGEASVTLEVLYGPIVTVDGVKNATRYVDVGDDVEVECNAIANPDPVTVEWVKQGDYYFHQISDKLQLKGISAINQGKYICGVVNEFRTYSGEMIEAKGNATVEIRLNHSPGTTYITPDSPVVVVGNQITLTCNADPPGKPTPTYYWRRENSNDTFTLGPDFIIPRASATDAGLYYCSTSNQLGNGTEASVNVKVIQLPRILKRLPESATYQHGKANLSITCKAEGDPVPSVKWLKNGKDLNLERDMYSILTSQYEHNGIQVLQSTLEFKGPDRENNTMVPSDRGIYLCIFHNEAGEVSTSQLIKLEHPPAKAHRFDRMAADIGDNAYLECRVESYPKPAFMWFIDGIEINLQQEKYSVNTTSLSEALHSSVLLVRDVGIQDYGKYTCLAYNDLGLYEANFTLQVPGPPSTPTNLYVESRGTNFLELGWEEGFNGGIQPTIFIVQAETEHAAYVNYDCRLENPCMIELSPELTLFNVRVKAENVAGKSNYSEPLEGIALLAKEDIPQPEEVIWNLTTNYLYFAMEPTEEMRLRAQVQIREKKGGNWKPTINHIHITSDSNYSMKLLGKANEKGDVRVRLCSTLVSTSCGYYIIAHKVGYAPTEASTSLPTEYIIAVAVVCAMVILAVIILCCCCQNRYKGTNRRLSRILLLTQRSFSSQASTIEYPEVPPTPDKDQPISLYFGGKMAAPSDKPGSTVTFADVTHNPNGTPYGDSDATDISSDASHSASEVTPNPDARSSSDVTHTHIHGATNNPNTTNNPPNTTENSTVI